MSTENDNSVCGGDRDADENATGVPTDVEKEQQIRAEIDKVEREKGIASWMSSFDGQTRTEYHDGSIHYHFPSQKHRQETEARREEIYEQTLEGLKEHEVEATKIEQMRLDLDGEGGEEDEEQHRQDISIENQNTPTPTTTTTTTTTIPTEPSEEEKYLWGRIQELLDKMARLKKALIDSNGGPVHGNPEERNMIHWLWEILAGHSDIFKCFTWEDSFGSEELVYLFYEGLPRPKARMSQHSRVAVLRTDGCAKGRIISDWELMKLTIDCVNVTLRYITKHDASVHPIRIKRKDMFQRVRWRVLNLKYRGDKKEVDDRMDAAVLGYLEGGRRREKMYRTIETREKKVHTLRQEQRRAHIGRERKATDKKIKKEDEEEKERNE